MKGYINYKAQVIAAATTQKSHTCIRLVCHGYGTTYHNWYGMV